MKMRIIMGLCLLAPTLLAVFAAPAWAAIVTIVQAGQAFSQTDVSLKAGDHLKFSNQDDVKHNILVQEGDDDDNAKDYGVQPPGQSVDVAFDKAGKFLVRCHIHPDMKMNVTVQ